MKRTDLLWRLHAHTILNFVYNIAKAPFQWSIIGNIIVMCDIAFINVCDAMVCFICIFFSPAYFLRKQRLGSRAQSDSNSQKVFKFFSNWLFCQMSLIRMSFGIQSKTSIWTVNLMMVILELLCVLIPISLTTGSTHFYLEKMEFLNQYFIVIFWIFVFSKGIQKDKMTARIHPVWWRLVSMNTYCLFVLASKRISGTLILFYDFLCKWGNEYKLSISKTEIHTWAL